MTRSLRHALAAALLPLLLAGAFRPAMADTPDDRLRRLGDEFLSRWLARNPAEATRLGAHTLDTAPLPVSRTSLAEDGAWAHDFAARLDSLPAPGLTRAAALDRALLAARVERWRLDLEVLRPYERDPGAYLALIAGSVESVLERPFAPACARLELAARRLAQVPEVLRAARINLRDPPRERTEIAIERYAAVLRFYRAGLPALTIACRDARTQADLAQADTAAVRATEDFLRYLREDLLPASTGPLAVGPEACARLIGLERLDDPLGEGRTAVPPADSLLARARAVVEERRAALDSLAAASRTDGTRAALEALATERPDANDFVPYMDRRLESVRDFLRGHAIVTLPRRDELEVREAPEFRGLLALTGLDAAGPWEVRGARAWLEVTRPDPAWDEAHRQAHLARFARHGAELSAMHDGLPGLGLRAIVLRAGPLRLRRALLSMWSAEGWGEYCEPMMLDEGYGAGDPGYRLAEAARALRFAGRSYAALAIHSGAMTSDQARAMLEERCLLDPEDAARETRTAITDPAIMGYTDAARQLLDLRDEVRRALGPGFRLRAFNDAVLRLGAVPAGWVRAGVTREMGIVDGPDAVGAKP